MDAPPPLTRQKQRTRLSGPERHRVAAELRAHYDAGASIREIAEKTGRSYGGVHVLLELARTKFRGRGGARPPRGH